MKIIKRCLILLILILIIMIIFIGIQKNRNNENIVENNVVEQENLEPDIKQVENPKMYFTVQACVEKYMNYIASNSLDIVYKLLDAEYKEKFSITEQNIQDYIETVYEDYNLKVKEMYVQEINKDYEKYYVKGILKEITGGEETVYGRQNNFSVTVKIDHKNMTFSIVPFGYGGVFYGE